MIDSFVRGSIMVEVLPIHSGTHNRLENHTLEPISSLLITLNDIAPPRILRLRHEREVSPTASTVAYQVHHKRRRPVTLRHGVVPVEVLAVEAVDVILGSTHTLYRCQSYQQLFSNGGSEVNGFLRAVKVHHISTPIFSSLW